MMDDDDWGVRLRTLEEAVATSQARKRKRAAEAFVRVPLWWAEAAVKATRSPKTLVWVRLLYLAWRDQTRTVRLGNRWFALQGVSRDTKIRALSELEAAGLITVERQLRQSPRVTILAL
jgi:hypothetical protein